MKHETHIIDNLGSINRLYLLPKLFSEMYFLFYALAFDDVTKFENVEF